MAEIKRQTGEEVGTPARPETSGPTDESHEALMARLYREHNQALIRFLMTRVDSEQEARDVAQEAYVRVLQLDTHGAVSFLSGYLFKTAANIAVDRVRRRVRWRKADSELMQAGSGGEAPEPERVLAAQEQLALMDRFLQELPLKCRQAFYLHRLYDMSPPDIAARIGVKKRMVHKYLVRAMTHLRARLEAFERTKGGGG